MSETATNTMNSGREARPGKVDTVAEITEKLATAQAVFVTEYRGLNVKQLAGLRSALRPDRRRAQGVQEHAGAVRRPQGGGRRPRADARRARRP